MKRSALISIGLALALMQPHGSQAASPGKPIDRTRFNPIDVFGLEYAADPQLSPDGQRIVYVRNSMDIMSDRRRSNLWIIDAI